MSRPCTRIIYLIISVMIISLGILHIYLFLCSSIHILVHTTLTRAFGGQNSDQQCQSQPEAGPTTPVRCEQGDGDYYYHDTVRLLAPLGVSIHRRACQLIWGHYNDGHDKPGDRMMMPVVVIWTGSRNPIG
jgi:hypothetical protein